MLLISCRTVTIVSDKDACPAVEEYTDAENVQLGKEFALLDKMPDMAMTSRAILDCKLLRENLRDCKG